MSDELSTTANTATAPTTAPAATVAAACKTFPDLVVSENDTRQYRAIELPNGLRALLIHDATTDKAAAALDVNVGSLSDPTNIQGLAHFLEHMLFLGTAQYPNEAEYSTYLSSHGGSSNAFTAENHTNYYFSLSHEYLEPALDRFASFFLTPLFDQSCTDRELNAVDSEHDKNIKQDAWRQNQVDRHLSDPSGPFAHFATGNRKTLLDDTLAAGIDLRQALLDFYAAHYSANIMCLAILGRESLDELQAMVLSKFSGVKNTNKTPLLASAGPYSATQLGRFIKVVPVKESRTLELSFVLPDETPHFTAQPGHYISHLVGHEGPGSLLSFLKEKGWASALMSGAYTGMPHCFSRFKVTIVLSVLGLEHVNDIVLAFFRYIALLRREGTQEWIFRECQQMQSMSFRFKEKDPPASYCSSLAGIMHTYPAVNTLNHAYLMTDYRPDLINEILNLLTPQRMRLWLIAADASCAQVEPYYGTLYSEAPLDPDLVHLWEAADATGEPSLRLPPINEFIPTDFSLRTGIDLPHNPVLLRETPNARLWHKQDDSFKIPRANVKLALISSMAYADPLYCNLTRLYLDVVKDSLAEFTYAAELGGLVYNVINTQYGLELTITGYTDKMMTLLRAVVRRVCTLTIDPLRFAVLKEQYSRFLTNFKTHEPHQRAVYYASFVLSERMYSHAERLAELDAITPEMVQSFGATLLGRLFVEALVHGNFAADESIALVDTLINTLGEYRLARPMGQLERSMLRRDHVLPDRSYYSYTSTGDIHSTSAIDMLFQIGSETSTNNVLLELLEQVIHVPFFSQLRTQEQLGYIVHSGIRRSGGVQYLRFIIQSDRVPVVLEARIFAFLRTVKALIEGLSDKEFGDYVEAVCSRKLEKPKNQIEETRTHWSEVSSGFYLFDRDDIEVPVLRAQTKADLIAFFDKYIAEDAPSRRVMGIRVVPSSATAPADTPDDSTPITDLFRFKCGLNFYSLPVPPAPASNAVTPTNELVKEPTTTTEEPTTETTTTTETEKTTEATPTPAASSE